MLTMKAKYDSILRGRERQFGQSEAGPACSLAALLVFYLIGQQYVFFCISFCGLASLHLLSPLIH